MHSPRFPIPVIGLDEPLPLAACKSTNRDGMNKQPAEPCQLIWRDTKTWDQLAAQMMHIMAPTNIFLGVRLLPKLGKFHCNKSQHKMQVSNPNRGLNGLLTMRENAPVGDQYGPNSAQFQISPQYNWLTPQASFAHPVGQG